MADKSKHKIKNLLQKHNDDILLNFWRQLMIKKKKARRPIPKIRTYLRYGFVITVHEYQHCPRCNHILNAGPNYQPKYCDQCGQKLDFSGVKWEKDKDLGYSERRDANEPIKNRVV